MYPLLEIKTVPIEIQMKTKGASLEYTRGTAEMEISRAKGGGVDVKSRPIQLRMDTFQPGGGQGRVPSAAPASPGYEATAAYAENGDLALTARIGQQTAQPVPAAAQTGDSESGYDPSASTDLKTSVNVQWEDGAMQIRYKMDKLNFDWKIDQGEFKFTPGDIEISVAQKPSVTIKYMGDPIYVPKSSDPNYQPVDVQA